VKLLKLPSVTFVAQTVTIGEQKDCPESESLKFSTTPTSQVENPSDSDSTALVAMPTVDIVQTHWKPETNKTGDSNNAGVCLYRSLKLMIK